MAGQIITKTINQEVIAEVNQPLYIGGKLADGSDAKITVASNGNVSTATPLTVPSLTVNSKPVMSSLLAEYTVTGSAVTSIDFSGLDINTHKSYRVEMSFINATATYSGISLFINGDATSTNYYSQNLFVDGSASSMTRYNEALFSEIPASGRSSFNSIILLTNNFPTAISQGTYRVSSSTVANESWSMTKTSTVTNITQITISAGATNSIGVGSTIRLYRGDV